MDELIREAVVGLLGAKLVYWRTATKTVRVITGIDLVFFLWRFHGILFECMGMLAREFIFYGQ